MKKIELDSWTNKAVTIEYYAQKKLDGSDYERGELETLRTENNLLKTALSKLFHTLAEKDVLSIDEVEFILDKYRTYERD